MNANQSGFTLIEVMIALAIFAVMAGAITLANSQSLTAAFQMTEQTEGRWVNQNVLAELRLAAAPDLGISRQEVTFNEKAWTVEILVEEVSMEIIGPYLRRVTLKAFVNEADVNPVDVLHAVLGDA